MGLIALSCGWWSFKAAVPHTVPLSPSVCSKRAMLRDARAIGQPSRATSMCIGVLVHPTHTRHEKNSSHAAPSPEQHRTLLLQPAAAWGTDRPQTPLPPFWVKFCRSLADEDPASAKGAPLVFFLFDRLSIALRVAVWPQWQRTWLLSSDAATVLRRRRVIACLAPCALFSFAMMSVIAVVLPSIRNFIARWAPPPPNELAPWRSKIHGTCTPSMLYRWSPWMYTIVVSGCGLVEPMLTSQCALCFSLKLA